MTDKQLKQTYYELYSRVYVNESYGTDDVQQLEGITSELARRGYEFKVGRPRIVRRKEV